MPKILGTPDDLDVNDNVTISIEYYQNQYNNNIYNNIDYLF